MIVDRAFLKEKDLWRNSGSEVVQLTLFVVQREQAGTEDESEQERKEQELRHRGGVSS